MIGSVTIVKVGKETYISMMIRNLFPVLAAIALVACASTEGVEESAAKKKSKSSSDYASAWIGRNIEEMYEEYGEPSWSREYVSDLTPGAARWYPRARAAGVTGRHMGNCFLDVLYDETGTIVRAASSKNRYCGAPRKQ